MSEPEPSCSSESDDSEESDDDLSLYNAMQDSGGSGLHRAVDFFKQTYPDEVFTIREQDGVDVADIRLSVSLNSLKDSAVDAWGLIKDLPLIVQMILDFTDYTKAKVQVCQISGEKHSSVFAQIRSIIERFCEMHLKDTSFGINERGSESSSGEKESKDSDQTAGGEVTASDLNMPTMDAKTPPKTSKGFFVQLHLYIEQRLLSLSDFCPVCDELHAIGTSTSMLKPVVCEKPLCIFSSQTLGLMANVVETVRLQPEVVHILMATTIAAVFSIRFHLTMQPWVDISLLLPDFEKLGLAKLNRRGLLMSTLEAMPPVETMITSSESDLRENLSLRHPLCYPLLRWVVSSNRSHIISLPEHKQLPFMRTELQFLLRNSPPIQDAKFRALAKKYGTVFAFHGSPVDNWHSILRKGLIVASGTDMELHGAAYGKGIYLTPEIKLAFDYTSVQKIPKMKHRTAYALTNCVTLCEVVNTPELKKHGVKWVCPDSKFVCTRFIFGYKCAKLVPVPINVEQQPFRGMVQAALQ